MKISWLTNMFFCRWFLLLVVILQVNGAVYRLDPANPRGFLVQNSKPSVAYIFVPPHTSRSTGLAVQSLKLEARLRWAKIPYHKISNQFFLGSPTEGSTPFMQYNGQYIEGANKIYEHLKKRKMPVDGEEAVSVDGSQKMGPATTREKDGKQVPVDEEVDDDEFPAFGEQKGLKGEMRMKKLKKKAMNVRMELKSAKNGIFKLMPTVKSIKETEILHSAKVLANILIADRIFRDPNGPNSGGLTYMLQDEGLNQQVAPILFELASVRREKEDKEMGREREAAGGSTSAAGAAALLVDGEKKNGNGKQQQQQQHAIGSGSGKGEIVEAEEKTAAIEVDEKKVPLPRLDRAFLKEYFALKNANPQDNRAQKNFLSQHQSLLADHFTPEMNHGLDGEKPLLTWESFDKWLKKQLQLELEPFLLDEQNGVERSWNAFLSDLSANETVYLMREKNEKKLMHIFKKAMKLVLVQISIKRESTFLFGPEPTETDALLFTVLLQYFRLGTMFLSHQQLNEYFNITNKSNLKLQMQLREYVDKMLRTLKIDPAWMLMKELPAPWKLNVPKWQELKWENQEQRKEMEMKYADQIYNFYGEKYNGPFRIAPTDNLRWLPDFDLSKIESKEIHRLLAEHGAKENAELLAVVLKKVVAFMQGKKFGEANGNYGKELLHLVAAYLCNLSGDEVPRGVLEEDPAVITEKAKQCNYEHLKLIEWNGPSMEWMVGVRLTIYEAVAEYNEGLVEERVEQAILEAAKEGRRADNGVGIEMF